MLTLYCDESGFSGPNLYDDPATHFVYVAVAIEPEEAAEAIARIKGFFRRHQGEIKFSSLTKRDTGVAALTWLLSEHGYRVKAWYANKKFATACKFFEYVFQPVLADHDALFYGNDFHRFVANLLYGALEEDDRRAHELLADLQKMLRSRDVSGLRRLLSHEAGSGPGDESALLTCVADVASGYRERIAEEVNSLARMGDEGVWMMDLTVTGFATVVRAHAQERPELRVICDTSKPLKAGIETAAALVQADYRPVARTLRVRHPLPAKLIVPIEIVKSSASVPGVQLADLFAGMVRAVVTAPDDDLACRWKERVFPLIVLDYVDADDTFIDADRHLTFVNAMVLGELARRARKVLDPVKGMAAVYQALHASPAWGAGR